MFAKRIKKEIEEMDNNTNGNFQYYFKSFIGVKNCHEYFFQRTR